MLTPEQIKACLNYLPFQEDEDTHKLSDKIVLARQDANCCICGQVAPAGTHHRVETVIVDGDLCSCHTCEICCAATAASHDDDAPLMARFALFNSDEVPS